MSSSTCTQERSPPACSSRTADTVARKGLWLFRPVPLAGRRSTYRARGQAGKQAGVKAMHADASLEGGKAVTRAACGERAAAGKRADALSWRASRLKQLQPGSTAGLSPGTAAHPLPPPHHKQPGRLRSSHRWGPASAHIRWCRSDSVWGQVGQRPPGNPAGKEPLLPPSDMVKLHKPPSSTAPQPHLCLLHQGGGVQRREQLAAPATNGMIGREGNAASDLQYRRRRQQLLQQQPHTRSLPPMCQQQAADSCTSPECERTTCQSLRRCRGHHRPRRGAAALWHPGSATGGVGGRQGGCLRAAAPAGR